MRKLIMLMILLSLSCNAISAVRKNVIDGETVTVKLSTKDPNVISIKGDRIERFSAVKGALLSQLDSKRGVLTVKPTLSKSKEPFSLIVFSEKGARYTLMIVPVAIPSQDIILKPEEIGQIDASKFENKSPYTEMVTSLIRHMVNGSSPEDYKVESLKEKSVKFRNGKLALSVVYHGSQVRGEIMKFRSATKYDFSVSEKYFYGPNVIAISISQNLIKPNSEILIYRVVKNG